MLRMTIACNASTIGSKTALEDSTILGHASLPDLHFSRKVARCGVRMPHHIFLPKFDLGKVRVDRSCSCSLDSCVP